MKMIVQLGPHCLLYSAAMLLDTHPDVLRGEIGYSGQEKWWPEAEKPLHRIRSFHIQEIVDCCLRRGFALTPIDYMPRMAPQGHEDQWLLMNTEEKLEKRFQEHIHGHLGLFIGQKPNGPHAVAWNGHLVFDPTPPKGYIYNLGTNPVEFQAREFWRLDVIKSVSIVF